MCRECESAPNFQVYCILLCLEAGLVSVLITKKFCEVLSKLKSRGFHATRLSTYDFSTLYTTFSGHIICKKTTRFDRADLQKSIKEL